MTTNKGVNRTFLITLIVYMGGSVLLSLIGSRVNIPFYLNIAVSQLLVAVPAFSYIKLSGMKVRELVPYRRIHISDALLAVLMTYLFYPLLLVTNLLTMFFVKNTGVGLAEQMQSQNLLLNIVFVAMLPACVEEFVFRGMLYHTYRRSSLRIGMFLSAFLFGCMHMNFNQFLYTFVFGIILVLIIEATGSILTSMVCHFVLNLNAVLLMEALRRIQNIDFGNAAKQSSSLMDNPQMLLLGLVSWLVIAAFTTVGAVGIWIHLARKNKRLELIHEKMQEPPKEKCISVSLVIGIAFAVAYMILVEFVR